MPVILANPILNAIHKHRALVFPLAFTGLLVVILVPLPTVVLDFLLTCNITLSIIVLVTTIYVRSPLEFSVFPSLLLALTMFRLVLNAAATRLVLTASGDPAHAIHAAGEVIRTFASFVTAGSLTVGVVIFIIIVVIQFVVITKGATRIAEVAARFMLDSMPGKQMAIDAELSAGSIEDAEARQRRRDLAAEADFYGAMDGASKFVRGDAIAGIIITCVNILGGLYVGLVEQHGQLLDCLRLYTKLTIGDGLVTQLPAFVVSLSAGLIVTRSSGQSSLGDDVLGQLFSKPKAMLITSGFLFLLALTSLPKIPLLILGLFCAAMAHILSRNAQAVQQAAVSRKEEAIKNEPENVQKFLDMDALELEIGCGLIKLADASRGGDLMERIANIRRQIATELGIIVPPVRIHDSPELSANDYLIKIRGQTVGKGVTYPEQFLAMDNGAIRGELLGATATTDPTFGLPAYWITQPQRKQAESFNFTIVDAAKVLETHLAELVKAHAHELLTRQEVKNLLDNLKARVPAVVEEVVPAQIKPGELQKVLQNLLRERVPVRDLETILETLGDFAGRIRDMDMLTEHVRVALRRTICKQYVDGQDRLWCLTLDPCLEELISTHIEHGVQDVRNTLSAQQVQRIAGRIAVMTAELAQAGRRPAVLCGDNVRRILRRMIENTLPSVAVLSYNEIAPEITVEAVMVGMDESPSAGAGQSRVGPDGQPALQPAALE